MSQNHGKQDANTKNRYQDPKQNAISKNGLFCIQVQLILRRIKLWLGGHHLGRIDNFLFALLPLDDYRVMTNLAS